MGMQRVLDKHGVSLAACLQTFDVMQASDSSISGAGGVLLVGGGGHVKGGMSRGGVLTCGSP